MEFRPKPLFGKMSYFREQAHIAKIVDNITNTVFALSPLEYIKEAFSTGLIQLPSRRLRPEFLKEERRLIFARNNAIEAKRRLDELGV